MNDIFCDIDINSFTLNRADTFIMPIIINKGTKLNPEKYILNNNDKLYIALLEPNQAFEDAILRKVITNKDKTDEFGNPLLVFNSSDTEYLLTGKYYLTIKLQQENNIVTTILPMKEFWLTGTDKSVCCD